ncbi:MAG: type II secretion system secretin GspD, partial [Bdellovibrionia bacterium]
MNVPEFDSPKKEYAPGEVQRELQRQIRDSNWYELSAHFACWIGIAGLILLISQGGRAQTTPGGRSGFLPGARPFNPFTNAPPGSDPRGNSAKGSNFYDDEDDDDSDGPEENAPMPPSRNMARPSAPRSYSAGGTQSSGPDPVITDKGVSVGGQSANGVLNRNKTSPLHIDDETAEGSKDIITDFNFPDADILDIAKTLGKLAGKNFILDKDVKGKITIISNSPITVGEAWKVFLTALDINGFALIPSGKYLRIARQRDARDKQLKTYTGEFSPDTDALITRVFPLKYISSEEVARTFRSFMPANARIIPYEQTNTVIVTDTGSNISKLAKMLEILDVEGYDAGIEVVPVKFASAAELSKLIDGLIPGTGSGGPGGPGGGMPRFGGGGGGRFSARRTKEGGIINTIIADERTNTLIVHANSRGADQVRVLVTKLDQKNPSTTGGGKVHVVYLQFADSEQIANTLNNFSSQSGSGKSTSAAGGPGATGTGANPIANSLFEGSIKIAPDKATNSLVITASPADFVTVQRVINRLDIPRDQVYVEVVIMEIAINRNFEYSANLAAPPLLGSIVNTDLSSFLTSPLTSTGALLGFAGGGTTNITMNGQSIPIGNVQGLVRAIQGHTNANILATPQIIALDNTEANFESAEKIPVSSTTITATGLSQQNITKEPVALSIKIKPQINKVTNFVKMDIATKLSEIQSTNVPKSLQGQAFSTLERTASTTVIVGDSDTVVLGGLIRTTSSENVTKIPILGDIPLLGWLFRAKTTQSLKSNLVILMTPHIVRQYEKIRAILDRKLKERDDFLEASTAGDDPQRWKRDEIIRSLPNLEDLVNKHPPTTITIDEDEPAAAMKPAAVAVPSSKSTETKPKSGKSGSGKSDVEKPRDEKVQDEKPHDEKPRDEKAHDEKPNDAKSNDAKLDTAVPPTATTPGQEPGTGAPGAAPVTSP